MVTSFTFRLYPLGPEVAFAAVMYPEEEMGDILRQWRAYMAKAPDEDTSIVVALTEIKAKYDPDNFFRINNNIVPAA